MEKKKVIKSIVGMSICTALVLSLFSGCSTSLSTAEIETALDTALQNSLASDLFYWKETDNRTTDTIYKQANVLSDIDQKEYVPLVDENGEYTTLRIQVIEKKNDKEIYQSVCGHSSGINATDEVKDYLFETVTAEDGTAVKTKQPMTAKEYYNSDAFRQYSVAEKLKCLQDLTVADMDFNADGAEISKKGNVTQLQFKVSDDYLRRYEEKYGEPSVLANSKRVLIEMAYEKISQIIVYVDEAVSGTSFMVETEAYNFQIVYLGPKFDVPKYNETDSATGEPVWKDA